jgi:glycosyltransferase involved in cell wall biosynthesis
MSPRVSVVIAAHNGAPFLGQAIESVLRQSYPCFELFVIDNGSTDNTGEVAKRHPEVRYVFSDQADAALARNLGVSLSSGEYIAFLDQDDDWIDDKLAKQVGFLESHPEYGACIGYQQMYLEKGMEKPHWLKQVFLDKPQLAYLPSALLVRRSTFLQTDRFNPSFPLASDVAWFFKAHHLKIPIGVIEEVIVHRRIHGDNMSNHYLALQKQILGAIKDSLRERRQ